MTLYQVMKKTAHQKRDDDSIVFYGKRYSFSKVLEYVDRAAAGLRKAGVNKGDTVTLCMPNTPSAQIAFYAINKVGAIVNLVHPKIAPVQLLEALKKTNSVMLIVYDLYLAGLPDFDGFAAHFKAACADGVCTVINCADNAEQNSGNGGSHCFKGGDANSGCNDCSGENNNGRYDSNICGDGNVGGRNSDCGGEKCNGQGGGKDKYDSRSKCNNSDNSQDADGGKNNNGENKKGAACCGVILMSKSDYFMGFVAKTYFKVTNRKKKLPNVAVFERLITDNAPDKETAEFDESEPAVYLPSGGTTGNPKIVMHSNKAFISLCAHGQYFLSEDISNFKAMYTVLPIFHGFGLCMNMLMCAQHGLKNVMSIKFSPKDIAKSVKKEGINIIMGVPSMFNKLIKSEHFNKADLSALKDCFVGGDNVPAKQIAQFNAILHRQGSRGKLYVGYGLTETVTVCAVNNSTKNKDDSVGAPLPDCQVKIFSKDFEELKCGEVGEIGIKTPIMMLGYLGSDFSPLKNINGEQWLFTGDLGYLDNDGFLFFKQRAKSMIKVSGIPVYPSEVEAAAQKIEGITRAAAIGVDDASVGQAVKLFAEVPNLEEINAGELKQKILKLCEQNLICYAVPKYIELRKNLPLNDIGKIDLSKL